MAEITYSDTIPVDEICAPALIDSVPNALGRKISCNMFKSESLYNADRKAPFSAYIKTSLEPGLGAHYYARSFGMFRTKMFPSSVSPLLPILVASPIRITQLFITHLRRTKPPLFS